MRRMTAVAVLVGVLSICVSEVLAAPLNARFTGAIDVPAGVWTIESADFDGDGSPDVVCGCVDNAVYAVGLDGRKLWDHRAGALPYCIATGDLTDDGKPEDNIGELPKCR